MEDEKSSKRHDKKFFGTDSYDEAIKLLQSGYDEAAKMLKKDVHSKSKISSKYSADVAHPIPHTAVVGYIPNVPNAIMNLPQSMITVDRKPMKRKTLSILFAQGGHCGQPVSYFAEAGSTLLSAIDLIEKNGIQTKIDLCFFPGKGDDQLTFPTICIKNFGERYSFQKVSFPLAHTSMFRRFGFRWLETTPELKDYYFRDGYGRPLSYENMLKEIKLEKNQYFVNTEWIHNHGNSVEELLKLFEVI